MNMTQPTLHLPNPQDWISITQAGVLIGVSRTAIADMIKARKLKSYTIGNHRVVWKEHAREMAAARAVAGRRVRSRVHA